MAIPIRPAVYEAMAENPPDLMAAATSQNAKRAADKAITSGPILSQLVAEGRLDSAAAVYDIATGQVNFL